VLKILLRSNTTRPEKEHLRKNGLGKRQTQADVASAPEIIVNF
jgi:hypothetical protein